SSWRQVPSTNRTRAARVTSNWRQRASATVAWPPSMAHTSGGGAARSRGRSTRSSSNNRRLWSPPSANPASADRPLRTAAKRDAPLVDTRVGGGLGAGDVVAAGLDAQDAVVVLGHRGVDQRRPGLGGKRVGPGIGGPPWSTRERSRGRLLDALRHRARLRERL